MSDASLNWQFNDDHETLDPNDSGPRRRLPWGKIFSWLIAGVLVLALAGLGGFVFGRYQRSTTAARADLQAAIDIETWAWQSGNRQLFTSSLDLGAKADWRRDIERQFETSGREIKSVTLQGFRFVTVELTEVTVEVIGLGRPLRETRYYRLINGQWRRTSPAQT